jgi:predicted small integral membrane protein
MAFALGARWMGFTADETITFFGGALMLAGMLTATERNDPPRR